MATILITGANRGIGLALVRKYLASADTVIATCRAPMDASELKETGAEVLALDVSDPESIAALVRALEGRAIDILINNAGIGDRAGFGALDFSTFEKLLAVNTIAPLRILEALADNLAAGSGKLAANLSSQLGSIENTTGDMGLTYRVSKAGLNMGLRAAAAPLAKRGITLLALHPGWVSSDMGGKQAPVTPDESAAGLYDVIAGAGPSETLRFLDWQGQTLPW